ncbi:MAG: hypothetical protein NTZ16_14230 [Verrucomicrobia bacterium]|nr:hypothetical protein [Verrucomicrobiota bacterium]
MSFPKPLPRFAIILCAAVLLAEKTATADIYALQTSARSLSVSLKNEAIAGTNIVRRVYVTAGVSQFAFGLPDGFRLNPYPEKILLTSAQDNCFLTFRLLTPVSASLKESETAICRRLALSQFPGATISGELAGRVANHAGPAFDLTWRNSGGGTQAARIAYIPVAAGVLEISLVTTPEKFGGDQYYYNSMLASMVTNESGKLEPAAPPGNS